MMVQVPAVPLQLSGKGCGRASGRANGGRGRDAARREVVMWQEDEKQPQMATAGLAPAKRKLSPAVLP